MSAYCLRRAPAYVLRERFRSTGECRKSSFGVVRSWAGLNRPERPLRPLDLLLSAGMAHTATASIDKERAPIMAGLLNGSSEDIRSADLPQLLARLLVHVD